MITTEDEDQGKLMVNILKSKETFKKSFMVSDFDEIVCGCGYWLLSCHTVTRRDRYWCIQACWTAENGV